MSIDGVEKLYGETIISFKLSDDKKEIFFESENKKFKLFAVGECCSESWIEHMDYISSGSIITEIIEKDVVEIESNDPHECLQKYFYEIITDKGNCTIEMRNSSNGYYGGFLHIEIQ